ncbi:MAG: outer membrane beta-barrel protein [Pseudomonadota bacterium]
MKHFLTAAALLLATTGMAAAEAQISIYGGYQTAPHSEVTISGTTPQRFNAGWEGKSFAMPPYYGVRGTWWLERAPKFGLSIDFTHAKVYADQQTLTGNQLNTLEFTDGINTLTLNGLYRFDREFAGIRPYVGAGLGVNIPHVEVDRINVAAPPAFGYQLGGMSAQAQVGLEYNLTKRIALFTEYKFNYNWVNVDVDGGDTLQTNIITNAVNFGLSYRF